MENNHKKLIIVLFLIFILPSLLFLSRPSFYGFDSHYYLSKVCIEPNHYSTSNDLPLTNIVFEALPCNLILLKLLLIGLFGLSILAFYKIAEKTWRGTGWLALLLTGISTVFLFSSFKFENDAFAIPLLLFSLYFFIKYLEPEPTFIIEQKKNYLSLILSYLLIGIAGLFWGGAIFYLIAFTFILFPKATILIVVTSFFIPQLTFITEKLISSITPDYTIIENNPALFFQLNFVYLMLLVFAIDKIVKKPWYTKLTAIFILLSFLNPKLSILAMPFIVLYMVKNYLIARKEFKFFKWKVHSKQLFIIFSVFLVITYSLTMALFTVPTNTDLQAVQETIQLSKETGLPINNDWVYGHLIWFNGGQTNQHSGPGHPVQKENTILLTVFEEPTCELKKSFEQQNFLHQLFPVNSLKIRPSLFLYQC